jgi:hypothetical protein
MFESVNSIIPQTLAGGKRGYVSAGAFPPQTKTFFSSSSSVLLLLAKNKCCYRTIYAFPYFAIHGNMIYWKKMEAGI